MNNFHRWSIHVFFVRLVRRSSYWTTRYETWRIWKYIGFENVTFSWKFNSSAERMDFRSEIKIIRIKISRWKFSLFEIFFSSIDLEVAMTVMSAYKQNGYLVRGSVFMNSILLYNSLSNFTDHEFDKEGLLRRVRFWPKKLTKTNVRLFIFSKRLMPVLLNLHVEFWVRRPIVNHWKNVI